MALPKYFERRDTSRKTLTGLMPGRLLSNVTGNFIECKPVDISAKGLGIISAEQMEIGTQLTLRTHNQEISLSVSWGRPDFGKRDLFRYGLEMEVNAENELDLREIFTRTGCMR